MQGGWVPNRQEPKLPVQFYTTYQAYRPPATHSRRATCQEVDCKANREGWQLPVDISTDLGARQANYIRLFAGRSFTFVQYGDLVTFTFPPGQRCFAEHRVNVDKPTLYLKRGGDWRAATSDPIPMREADWVDDCANHQIGLAEHRERG